MSYVLCHLCRNSALICSPIELAKGLLFCYLFFLDFFLLKTMSLSLNMHWTALE